MYSKLIKIVLLLSLSVCCGFGGRVLYSPFFNRVIQGKDPRHTRSGKYISGRIYFPDREISLALFPIICSTIFLLIKSFTTGSGTFILHLHSKFWGFFY